jgi:hypothetical protein
MNLAILRTYGKLVDLVTALEQRVETLEKTVFPEVVAPKVPEVVPEVPKKRGRPRMKKEPDGNR